MYVRYKGNGTNCVVDTIYYDATGVPKGIIDRCIRVDTLPVKEVIEGKEAKLYCNPTEGTVFYVYEDIMVRVSQASLNAMQAQIASLQAAVEAHLDISVIKGYISKAEKATILGIPQN